MSPDPERTMTKNILCATLAATIAVIAGSAARAASLQAAPVLLEMKADAPSSTISIRNTGTTPFAAQTRVFRWKQAGGKETMEETNDVVTSPPITTLQPGASYSIRVVRTSKQPLPREEAFRVLVDQLPDSATQRSGTVALVMRHSIPVFLMPPAVDGPKINWSVASRNGRLMLRAQNTGDRRVRLSQVSVKLAGGRTISFGNGLLGYALAGSTMEWLSPGAVDSAAIGAGARIIATTEQGAVDVSAGPAR
jgi:fimbrial chaperone protein